MDQQNITASDVIISVKDLKKYYNEGAVKALDGITTDIRRGEVTVIIVPFRKRKIHLPAFFESFGAPHFRHHSL